MLQATEGLRYRGVSVGWALRVSYHVYLRDRLSRRGSLRRRLRAVLEPLALLARNLWRGRRSREAVEEALRPLSTQPREQVVVVCDGSGHTEDMARDLLARFAPLEVLLLSSNSAVCARMRDRFPACVDVYGVLARFSPRLLPDALRLFVRLARRLPRRPLTLLLFLLPRVISFLQAVRFYERFFETARASAVVTMCDSHWHEFTVTEAARGRGICTYTNLHGDPAVLIDLIPIASDRVFVWGERSRDHLVANGVPPDQVMISGNPKFDRVFSSYLPRRPEIRAALLRRLDLPPERPVVTFLSSGLLSTAELTEEVAFTLFSAFAAALTLPASALVKLHPNDDSPEMYRAWMDRLGARGMGLLQKEDLFEVLAATDIAVTFHSTTGLEAIGFGIPTLVMNFIPGIDVKEYITYAPDTIECRSEEALRETLRDLLARPERRRLEEERTRKGRTRYFQNGERFDTSAFVHDHILRETDGR